MPALCWVSHTHTQLREAIPPKCSVNPQQAYGGVAASHLVSEPWTAAGWRGAGKGRVIEVIELRPTSDLERTSSFKLQASLKSCLSGDR